MLQSAAADNLASAAASVNDYITLNSAWRSSAEQYMLYQWYLKGICSISLAAAPGTSNHEGGRAVDTSNYNYWLNTLSAYGWVHSYPSSDPVHFDYNGSPDIAQQGLIAFQRLWNANNPNSQLTVDGIYGPATADALYNTPCNGW
jgi:LAS superfamily LD-carboxypeptidase LdcB